MWRISSNFPFFPFGDDFANNLICCALNLTYLPMCPESGTGTSPATGRRWISETASCCMFFEVKKKILEVALSLTGADEEEIEVSWTGERRNWWIGDWVGVKPLPNTPRVTCQMRWSWCRMGASKRVSTWLGDTVSPAAFPRRKPGGHSSNGSRLDQHYGSGVRALVSKIPKWHGVFPPKLGFTPLRNNRMWYAHQKSYKCMRNMNQIFSTNMFHVKVCCLFGQWGKDLVDLGCRMCRQSAARAPPRLSDELKKELPGINLPVACQCGRSEAALSEELWVKYIKI